MIPAAFSYHAPTSIADATALLVKYGEDAKILSGGQSLLKAPAGLDIGAITPEEIAISILAEIVQVARSQPTASRPAGAPVKEAPETVATDPVCGMPVEIASARYRSTVAQRDFYFCGAGCQRAFDHDPARFAGSAAG